VLPRATQLFEAVDSIASILDTMASTIGLDAQSDYPQVAEDARASLAHAFLVYRRRLDYGGRRDDTSGHWNGENRLFVGRGATTNGIGIALGCVCFSGLEGTVLV